MAVDVRNFITPEQGWEGLNQLGQTLERRNLKEMQFRQQNETRKAATSRFLTDYLDQKQFLTGTNYDPMIVNELNDTLKEGAALAMKGADMPTLIMALGPRVQRINEYSTKAKLIDNQVKSNVQKLKGLGYNSDALEDRARKMAFFNEDGSLKDITKVDPNMDFVTETVKMYPEEVTTSQPIDEFVAKVPMQKVSRETQTMYGGRKRNVKYDAEYPFYEELAQNEKGEPIQDISGNPVGLDVISTTIMDDKGKPMINPETGKAYRVMDERVFNSVLSGRPGMADWLRGQVKLHYKDFGADKMPKEGSPQWELLGRAILYDELNTRRRSTFRIRENETKSAPATRIELGYTPYEPRGSGKSNSSSAEPTIRDIYNEVNTAIENVPSIKGIKSILMNSLSASAQAILIKYANDLTKDDLVQGDLALIKGDDGKINLARLDTKQIIAPLGFQDVNIPAQPSVKEKREVIKNTPKQPTPKSPSGIKWR